MTWKIQERINYYSEMLARKERLVEPFHDTKNKLENLSNNEYLQISVLETEINQIKEFIEDLKYIKE